MFDDDFYSDVDHCLPTTFFLGFVRERVKATSSGIWTRLGFFWIFVLSPESGVIIVIINYDPCPELLRKRLGATQDFRSLIFDSSKYDINGLTVYDWSDRFHLTLIFSAGSPECHVIYAVCARWFFNFVRHEIRTCVT